MCKEIQRESRGYVYLQHVLNPGPRVRFHQTFDPNQRLHLCVQSVTHELKLAIRRDEADRPVILEAGQPHTLVKLDILHLHGLASRSAAGSLKHGLVVQSQPQLRHTTQITLHFDSAENLGPQHVPVRRDQQVQRLNHIQEHLVLAVADAFASPGDCVCDCDWRPCLHFQLV